MATRPHPRPAKVCYRAYRLRSNGWLARHWPKRRSTRLLLAGRVAFTDKRLPVAGVARGTIKLTGNASVWCRSELRGPPIPRFGKPAKWLEDRFHLPGRDLLRRAVRGRLWGRRWLARVHTALPFIHRSVHRRERAEGREYDEDDDVENVPPPAPNGARREVKCVRRKSNGQQRPGQPPGTSPAPLRHHEDADDQQECNQGSRHPDFAKQSRRANASQVNGVQLA